MWPSLLKIQYTELKLSCGNDPVVKISIYSNGDLDLWPNDPKINRVLSLTQGNHVAKFGKDPIYRSKVIVRKLVRTPARPPYPITFRPSQNCWDGVKQQSLIHSLTRLLDILKNYSVAKYNRRFVFRFCYRPFCFSWKFRYILVYEWLRSKN